jgi:hypothetical protein
MKKNDPGKKVTDLLHNKLSPEEREEVISQLKVAGIDSSELESMNRINSLIDKMPQEGPSDGMDRRFYEMLADELKEAQTDKVRSKSGNWYTRPEFTATLRIAAGIALFVLGWFMASWTGQRSVPGDEIALLSTEVKDLKATLVLTMMNQTSTLERIKAVNMVSEFDYADERLLNSLLDALNHDENDNVRLLSLEALIRYSSNPVVMEGLISSIPNQTSPMIQLRLAEVMVALNEKKAASGFQKILMNTGLNYNVRNKINEAVAVLL